MKISLLVSSRGRPDMLVKMWRSANETRFVQSPSGDDPLRLRRLHTLELVLYLDEDDKSSIDAYYNKIVSLDTLLIVGPRKEIIGETTNLCYKQSTGEICMLCTDDVIFHTLGWDDMVVKEFAKYPDRIALVYGEDGIQHGHTATLPFLHRNWIDEIGHFLPTHFVNEFGDRWLTDVATKVNRKVYLWNLYIQHLHPTKGDMPYDATYTERRQMRSSKMSTKQWRDLYSSLENIRKDEAKKLQFFINNFKE